MSRPVVVPVGTRGDRVLAAVVGVLAVAMLINQLVLSGTWRWFVVGVGSALLAAAAWLLLRRPGTLEASPHGLTYRHSPVGWTVEWRQIQRLSWQPSRLDVWGPTRRRSVALEAADLAVLMPAITATGHTVEVK